MPPELSGSGRELAGRLLAETREDVAKADGKAQILLAAALVVTGVILGGIIAGDWRPEALPFGPEVVWWGGVVLVIGGLAGLGDAVRPRLGDPDPDRTTYFEEVIHHDECRTLIPALNVEGERGERDAEQLLCLSVIAHDKYRSVKLAIWALGIGPVLCLLGSLLG